MTEIVGIRNSPCPVRELELNRRIKPKKRPVREKPEVLPLVAD